MNLKKALEKVFDLPYSASLYEKISEVEILLETLNWINRENSNRKILAELGLIEKELKRIKGGLRERKIASATKIAEFEAVGRKLATFRKNVTNALSTHVSREAMEVLQQRLEREFTQFNNELTAVFSRLKPLVNKMELSYN